MASFVNITNNAKFRPFSYAEMLAPLQAYATEYNTVNESLSNLGDVANTYSNLLDPESKRAVDAYNQRLQDAANDLSAHGLEGVNRNTIYSLRRAYTSDISRINKAAANLDTIYKTMQQAQLRDGSMMYANVPTVSDLVKNPAASPTAVSGNQLYAYGANSAKAASARRIIESDPVVAKGVEGYLKVVKAQGYNSQEAERFRSTLEGIPELKQALNDIKEMSGANQLNDNDQRRSDAYILNGIMSGIGYAENTSYMADKGWDEQQKRNDMALEHQYRLDEMQQEYTLKAQEAAAAAGNDDIDWNAVVADSGNNKEFAFTKNLVGKLSSGKSSTALSKDYFGNTYDSTYNPMSVYLVYQKKLADDRKRNESPSNKITGVKGDVYYRHYYDSAGEYLENLKKRGITKILTTDEYNALKNMGFKADKNDWKNPFQVRGRLNNGLNVTRSNNSYYNFGNSRAVSNYAGTLITNMNVRGKHAGVYELDDNLNRKSKDLGAGEFSTNENDDKNIKDIGVRIKRVGNGNQATIIVTRRDGKRYEIDPSNINGQVGNIFSNEAVNALRAKIIKDNGLNGKSLTEQDRTNIDNALAETLYSAAGTYIYKGWNKAKGYTGDKD